MGIDGHTLSGRAFPLMTAVVSLSPITPFCLLPAVATGPASP